MTTVLRKIIRRIKGIGIYYRKLLRICFGFDRWHIRPLAWKKYATEIISYCNKQEQRNCFVEIGCGLGDIIRHVKFVHRFGYDLDAKVLKAAKFLSLLRQNIQYHTFSFPEDSITICGCEKFDVIVLVNWIHNVQPSILRQMIGQYYTDNLNAHGMIICDTVQDCGYKYNHDINYLTYELKCTIEKICEDAPRREIWGHFQNPVFN